MKECDRKFKYRGKEIHYRDEGCGECFYMVDNQPFRSLVRAESYINAILSEVRS